jgi:hypothetical protein
MGHICFWNPFESFFFIFSLFNFSSLLMNQLAETKCQRNRFTNRISARQNNEFVSATVNESAKVNEAEKIRMVIICI